MINLIDLRDAFFTAIKLTIGLGVVVVLGCLPAILGGYGHPVLAALSGIGLLVGALTLICYNEI